MCIVKPGFFLSLRESLEPSLDRIHLHVFRHELLALLVSMVYRVVKKISIESELDNLEGHALI